MGMRLQTRLSPLFPNLVGRVESQQENQKKNYESVRTERTFKTGDLVHVRNFSWVPGIMMEKRETYNVQVQAKIVSNYPDHLRSREPVPMPASLPAMGMATASFMPRLEVNPTPSPLGDEDMDSNMEVEKTGASTEARPQKEPMSAALRHSAQKRRISNPFHIP